MNFAIHFIENMGILAVDNLKMATDAVSFEIMFHKKLEETILKPNCSLFSVEDSLLCLSASDFVDGIFFCDCTGC